ncbi:MAG: SDR family NAD(P)-dependent oxidoreductase [Pseudomonas sp.]|uniref:SDR family NAD(P)-dependent oxidoreductase n=1 Tax=Pseudomonas sp. TaxID=306 RepID=UPI0039827609
MPLSENVVMITGAAGALGREVAAAYQRSGATLVLLDVDAATLQSAYPTPAANKTLLQADLLNEASVAAAVAKAVELHGRIDVLCNIAGSFYYGEPVHEMRRDAWLQQFQVNATTVVNAVGAVVPGMIAQGRGNIFTIGAAAHVQGHAHVSAYAAAKSAVMRLSESMAEELRGTGVNVLCLMPTIIDTPKNRVDMPDADFSQWTPPAAIAELMVLLGADAASLMSGSCIPLNGEARVADRRQATS